MHSERPPSGQSSGQIQSRLLSQQTVSLLPQFNLELRLKLHVRATPVSSQQVNWALEFNVATLILVYYDILCIILCFLKFIYTQVN